MTWLVTGGAGYIGAHVVRAMSAAGYDIVVLDDLSTGRIERLPDGIPLYKRDVGGPEVGRLLRDLRVDGVVHLAAKKSVPESVAHPLYYYEQNVASTVALLRAAVAGSVRAVVYSSSAAVYGETGDGPVSEERPTVPINPYGETKLAAEWAVRDAAKAHGLRWCALRYFNVAGAVDTVLADRGVDNLIPRVRRAIETGEPLDIFGADYDTPDGTCVRDYVHVADLADAHVAAVNAIEAGAPSPGTLNVGRNAGISVREIVEAAGRILDDPSLTGSRHADPGIPARVVADASAIARGLGWEARRGIEEMVSPPPR